MPADYTTDEESGGDDDDDGDDGGGDGDDDSYKISNKWREEEEAAQKNILCFCLHSPKVTKSCRFVARSERASEQSAIS